MRAGIVDQRFKRIPKSFQLHVWFNMLKSSQFGYNVEQSASAVCALSQILCSSLSNCSPLGILQIKKHWHNFFIITLAKREPFLFIEMKVMRHRHYHIDWAHEMGCLRDLSIVLYCLCPGDRTHDDHPYQKTRLITLGYERFTYVKTTRINSRRKLPCCCICDAWHSCFRTQCLPSVWPRL